MARNQPQGSKGANQKYKWWRLSPGIVEVWGIESGKYTWTNKRVGPSHIASRLDIFFLQISFLLLGLEARVHILPCSTFDHKPIKLELVSQLDLGFIPFRFSPLWAKEFDFTQIVKDICFQWVKGSPFFVWEEKLRRVKRALKSWAKSLPNLANERKKKSIHFGNPSTPGWKSWHNKRDSR